MFENYVYPPRPASIIPTEKLQQYENMKMFFAQPKLNGSCCVIIINGDKINFYNRHKETFTKFDFPVQEMRDLMGGKKLTVLIGEYLNKSQADETGKAHNGRIYLFDILNYDGTSLVGQSADDRQKLLRSVFELKPFNTWCDRISENLFIVKNFETGFAEIWKEITPIPVYEGLVLKKKHAKLKPGTVKANNTDWQVKCRKPTKNYSY